MLTSILAGGVVLLLLLCGLFMAALAAGAAVLFTRRPKALPGYRWRNLQRDADEKFAARQLDDDYRTLIEQNGYDIVDVE